MRIHSAFLPAIVARPRVELQLRREDGSPWNLTISAGMERFIGYYPKVEGISSGEPLLSYSEINPAR